MLTITKGFDDKHYLDTREIDSLERYARSFPTRVAAYNCLRDRADDIVKGTLKLFSQSHPAVAQKHMQRCLFDMSHVLRYVANSVLQDDEQLLRDQMINWLETVIRAYHASADCAVAYRHMQTYLKSILPAEQASLVVPMVRMIEETLIIRH
jgi:hypothetical protein